MDNTTNSNNKLLYYARWGGAAAILGGVVLLLATVIFVLTHGTQSEAQHGTLLGLRSAQYAKVFQPIIWLSFLLGIIGVNAIQGGRANRLGKAGFMISILGYGLATFSWILQTWIVDPDRYFRSVFVQGGFSLWLLSIFVQTVGMTLFGFAILRVKALPFWNGLSLLTGLLLLPAGLFQLFVFDQSDGSFVWSWIYISSIVPYSLCWVLLGFGIWKQKLKTYTVLQATLVSLCQSKRWKHMATPPILLTSWYKPALLFASLAAFGRGFVELFRPDYWNPRTALDYTAVAGTSLMLLFLAPGLWGFFRQYPVSHSRAATVWRAGIITSCISAAIIGISNFVEDALGNKGLGYVWVVGILVLFASLIIAGLSAFWVHGLPRLTGVLLLMSATGLLFMASVGLFGLGLALVALGMLKNDTQGGVLA